MKGCYVKKILAILLLVGVVLAQDRLEITCDPSYKSSQCQDDWTCGASKCLIKNTDLLGAVKNDLSFWLEQEMRQADGFNEDKIALYKKALASKTLLSQKFVLKDPYCFLEIKRLDAKTIYLEKDPCYGSGADFSYTYKQVGKDVERIEHLDTGQ